MDWGKEKGKDDESLIFLGSKLGIEAWVWHGWKQKHGVKKVEMVLKSGWWCLKGIIGVRPKPKGSNWIPCFIEKLYGMDSSWGFPFFWCYFENCSKVGKYSNKWTDDSSTSLSRNKIRTRDFPGSFPGKLVSCFRFWPLLCDFLESSFRSIIDISYHVWYVLNYFIFI